VKKKSAKKGKTKPANRHKTGFRGPTPDVGKETQFKPGQSGNPSGRPPAILSDAYREVLAEAFEGDSAARSYARLIALGQARAPPQPRKLPIAPKAKPKKQSRSAAKMAHRSNLT
jgi:hypothetical protein